MTEADEVAATMLVRVIELGGSDWSMEQCRHYVRQQMRDETEQVVDNVAWSLFRRISY